MMSSSSSGVLAEIDLFLCTAARLFYPVHVVVVLDAMCRIDGGVRDDVLAEQLKLNASQVREALMTLYEEKVLVHSHVKMERNGLSTKNQKVFYLSRRRAINTIRFRLHRMHDLVDEQIRSANEIGAYSCAQCKAAYSDFDYGRIFDARTQALRCASCGGALEERSKVSEDEVVLKRLLNEQTEALRQADLAIKHVPVPPMAKDVVLSLSGVVVQADTRYLPEQGDASYADRVLAAYVRARVCVCVCVCVCTRARERGAALRCALATAAGTGIVLLCVRTADRRRNRLRARKNDNAITLPDAASMPQANTIVVSIEKDDGGASASAAAAAAAASESAKKRVHFLDGSRAPSAAGAASSAAADAAAASAGVTAGSAAGEHATAFDESTLMACTCARGRGRPRGCTAHLGARRVSEPCAMACVLAGGELWARTASARWWLRRVRAHRRCRRAAARPMPGAACRSAPLSRQ
jgi:transcription initiation factor IIE alpha subunit